MPRLNCFDEHCRQRFHSQAGKAGVAPGCARVGEVAFVGEQDGASDSVHVRAYPNYWNRFACGVIAVRAAGFFG